jgi:hypothetical protein
VNFTPTRPVSLASSSVKAVASRSSKRNVWVSRALRFAAGGRPFANWLEKGDVVGAFADAGGVGELLRADFGGGRNLEVVLDLLLGHDVGDRGHERGAVDGDAKNVERLVERAFQRRELRAQQVHAGFHAQCLKDGQQFLLQLVGLGVERLLAHRAEVAVVEVVARDLPGDVVDDEIRELRDVDGAVDVRLHGGGVNDVLASGTANAEDERGRHAGDVDGIGAVRADLDGPGGARGVFHCDRADKRRPHRGDAGERPGRGRRRGIRVVRRRRVVRWGRVVGRRRRAGSAGTASAGAERETDHTRNQGPVEILELEHHF